MTTIYCKRSNNALDFFITDKGNEYYMFSQRPYTGVEEYFKKGIALNNAIKHSKCGDNKMIHKTITKLPTYIKYIEKEYGIALLEQSKKKLRCVA